MTNDRSKVRFGLIGCGEIAVQTARALQAAPETCAITAVQDVVEDLASDLGRRLNVPHCTAPAELLARNDVDAVVISTPHYLHAPLTIQAARAGKHVACEKPLACTLAQADEMLAACRSAGVRLSVCYVGRYDPIRLKAAELLRAGALGRIIRYRAALFYGKPETYWSGGYSGRNQSDWRRSKEQAGGGVLLMNGSHSIDFIHWITGLRPVRVFAESDTHATAAEVEDNIAVVARYSNGALGSLDAMSCARGKEIHTNRLYGTLGTLDFARPLGLFTQREDLPGIVPNEWNALTVDGGPPKPHGRAAYLADFARAILADAPETPISGAEARQTLAFCLAAYESARTHCSVEL